MNILQLTPKVRAIALSIYRKNPRLCLDDLVQEGWIGALKAQKSFDSSRGVPFHLYSTKRITGAMRDYTRTWDILSRNHRHNVQNGYEIAPKIFSLSVPKNIKYSLLWTLKEEDFDIQCDDGYKIILARVINSQLMQKCCTKIGKVVLYYYFTSGRTQREISEILKVRQTKVASILRCNLKRMRTNLTIKPELKGK